MSDTDDEISEYDEAGNFIPPTRFKSKEAYHDWCASVCQRLYVLRVAGKPEKVPEILKEIDRTLYLTDHMELYP